MTIKEQSGQESTSSDEDLVELKKRSKSKSKNPVAKPQQDYNDLLCEMRTRGILRCDRCNPPRDFEDLRELKSHTQAVHNRITGHIQCCDVQFRYHEIVQHMRYHRDPSTYKCSICPDESFMCRRFLIEHERRVHSIGCTFQCKHCDQKFPTEITLDTHGRTQHPSEYEPFECDECGRRFPLAHTLSNHKKVAHPAELSHICDVCGKGFGRRYLLKDHQKSHLGAKEQCSQCHVMVVNLKRHTANVHKPKEYVPCRECGKQLEKGRRETIHYKQHHSGQNFRCDLCGKEFKLKSVLRVHMDTHLGRKFQCYFCPFEATSVANRCKHMHHRHPGEYAAQRAKRGVEGK